MEKNILTEEERLSLRGMAKYWNEVRKREDKSPLRQEVRYVTDLLGVKTLRIIEAYLNECEE